MLHNYINQIQKFDDIYQIMSPLTKKEKGDLFEEFIKYIFIYHPFYKDITNKIWMYSECPEDIKKKLNIPENDEGIDLIMFSNDEKYYAIQTKFRMDKNTKITWEELGTFVGMTFGVGNNFSGGFFVTNTIPINKNILNSNKLIPIHGSFFDDIPTAVYDFMKKKLLNQKKDIQYNRYRERPYQKKLQWIQLCILIIMIEDILKWRVVLEKH